MVTDDNDQVHDWSDDESFVCCCQWDEDDDAFALSEPSSLTASLINQFGSPLGTIVSIDILALL